MITIRAVGPSSTATEVAQRWAALAACGFIPHAGRGRPLDWLAWLGNFMVQEPSSDSPAAAIRAAEQVGLVSPLEDDEPDSEGVLPSERRRIRFTVALGRARKRWADYRTRRRIV